jgi:hypothetical protein
MRAVVLLLGVMLVTNALGAQGPTFVSGAVRDETGGPIREALVVVDPDSLSLRTRTGVDGRYRIAVPSGRFEVRIVRIGFRPQSQNVVVSGTDVELNVVMQSVAIPLDTVAVRVARAGLYGLVVTRGINLLPHEPRALAGASVEVIGEPYRTTTGADGRFSIPQLGFGFHSLLITLDRFSPRVIPVTIPEQGGLEFTFTIDSMFARHQFFMADRVRAIKFRQARARSPSTFVSGHELDPNAKSLMEALRYAPSVLSRGVFFQNQPVCIYVDNIPAGNTRLEDLETTDIEGIEVYPGSSLPSSATIPPGDGTGNPGIPCFVSGQDNPTPQRRGGPFVRRSEIKNPTNQVILVMIWTNKRR